MAAFCTSAGAMSEFEMRLAHCIRPPDAKSKYGNLLVPIEQMGKPIQKFWMTKKQHKKITSLFFLTPNGYSCRRFAVYFVIQKEGDVERYVWAGGHSEKTSDLPWLKEKFGVEPPPDVVLDLKEMEVPENVQVDPSLLDAPDGSPDGGSGEAEEPESGGAVHGHAYGQEPHGDGASAPPFD